LLVVRCWSWNWNYRRRNGNTVSKLRLLKWPRLHHNLLLLLKPLPLLPSGHAPLHPIMGSAESDNFRALEAQVATVFPNYLHIRHCLATRCSCLQSFESRIQEAGLIQLHHPFTRTSVADCRHES
jgi:hypothetical protein